MYLTSIQNVDEKQAKEGLERKIGIRVNDIINMFEKELTIKELKEVIIAEIISSWDIGLSSYVIEEIKIDDTKSVIDGFIRNGEQTYRNIFEIYSVPYAIFYKYFVETCEYQKGSLMELAQYLDENLNKKDFISFINSISIEDYLDKEEN